MIFLSTYRNTSDQEKSSGEPRTHSVSYWVYLLFVYVVSDHEH